jgi:D-alanyl-D-alanine carboxypeptidase
VERIANADVVTVRQLLGMRSGIDDYLAQPAFFDRVLAEPDHVWTAEEALTYAYDLPALFAPDEEFNYSNSNYLLAQLVLEDAAGLPLHTLMRERILDPLGMDDTYTQISETLDGGFVDSLFDFDGDGILDNLSLINDGAGLGDGALVSTAADLTTFYKALLQDQTLLPEAAMETLLDFADTGEGDSYSLGLTRLETPWGDAWGHSGGVVGFASVGAYLPELDTTVIVLSTSPNFDPTDLALDAVELLAG